MEDFSARVRVALVARGMSMRGAAHALNYDPAYLSRVLNRKQPPSPQLAEALDELLGANGELVSLIVTNKIPARAEYSSGLDADIAYMQASATHLLEHADKFGGDTVAPVAVQVWRSAQRRLDAGLVPEKEQRSYLSAAAEAAEVAGWLLFDAGQWDAARTAFLESQMLARHAGDREKQWFALDMLAMLDIERERPAEALRIADELMCQRRVPPRVTLLARVRRGRALAHMGDRQRALTDLNTARGGVEDSLSHCDPGWTWWVDHNEVRWHRGAALLDLGAYEKAASTIQGAIERLSIPDGRGALHLRIGLLSSFVGDKAWREAEVELVAISSLLDTVSSGRNRHILKEVLRTVSRDSGVPFSLADLAREVRGKAA